MIPRGLTERQRHIAQQMWLLDTDEEVDYYIATFRGREKIEASTIKQLILIEMIDREAYDDQTIAKLMLTSIGVRV